MAPVQTKIVPVSDKFMDYAEKLERELHAEMVRVEIDRSSDSFNKKVRNAITDKCPNILIIGGNEVESESVTWRRYCVKDQRTMKFSEFVPVVKAMIDQRLMDNYPDEELPG
jgi:threonyl-tRNA synthetase